MLDNSKFCSSNCSSIYINSIINGSTVSASVAYFLFFLKHKEDSCKNENKSYQDHSQTFLEYPIVLESISNHLAGPEKA